MRLISAIAIAMLAVLAAPAAAAPVTDADFLKQFPPGEVDGTGAGQLSVPTGIATDPVTGHVYVVGGAGGPEESADRVDEYTPWGEFVKAFGYDVAPGAVNEVQEVRVRSGAGQFKLSFEAASTPDLPFDASGEEVEDALNALATISAGGGAVAVEERAGNAATSTPFVYLVTFKTTPLAGKDVAQIGASDGTTALSGGSPATSLEARTVANGTPGGTGLEACTAESGCQAGIPGALGGQMRKPGGIAVGPDGSIYSFEKENQRVQRFTSAGTFVSTFGGDVITDGANGTATTSSGSVTLTSVATTSKAFEVGQQISGAGIPAGTTIAAVGNETITLSQPAAASGAGIAISAPEGAGNVPTNERQTVTLGSGITGGSFTLTFTTPNPSASSGTTEPIPFDATALEVEEELEGLANIGAGNVAVTGPAGGPWVAEFKGTRFADTDVAQMSADASGLTVGSSTKSVEVTAANAAEVCTVAAECRSGAVGNANGQFGVPNVLGTFGTYIDAGSDGTLYVGDRNRIQKFSAAGAFQAVLALPKAGNPGALAFDPDTGPNGTIYFAYNQAVGMVTPNVLRLDGASGAELGTPLSVEVPATIATDGEGNVYVGESYFGPPLVPKVIAFDETGEEIGRCCETELFPGKLFRFELPGVATNGVGDLYVVNARQLSENLSYIRAYGSPPVLYEAPSVVAPTISAQWAEAVGSETATLRAEINPHFWVDTTYRVEYGPADCASNPCASVPAAAGKLLTGKVLEANVRTTATVLGDLAPGTTYHYRFVAQSGGGGPVFGPDQTFTTFTPPGKPDSGCANRSFRTGPAAALPDCRAYELVSPLDKEGGDIFTLVTFSRWRTALEQSATDGESFTYSSYRSFGGADSAPFASQYLASRTPAGWSSEPLSPPRAAPTLFDGGEAQRREFKAFSPDLRSAWLVHDSRLPLEPEAPSGYAIPYSRTASAEYEALIQVTPPGVPAIKFKPELLGFSADGSKAVFRAPAKLTPSASSASGSALPINQTYMSIGGGALRLVSILPDGKASDEPSSAGTANDGRGDTGGQSVAHAVSDDGTRVWWTTGPNATAGPGALYLRLNADKAPSKVVSGECTEAAKACTLEVSGLLTSSPSQFQTASPDGERVIFSVTAGALKGNLYEADFSDPSAPSTRLIAGGLAGGSQGEGALLAAGEDAKRIYFASEEVLDAGAKPGEPNLYLHDGAETRYIATLSAQDANPGNGVSPLRPEPAFHVAQASPDGEQLLFASTGSPTGYDNAEILSGEPVTEVYRYDATAAGGAGQLACVSCNPSGARPAGHAPLTIHPWQNVWIGSTIKPPRTHFHTPNSLSADGEVAFFDSYDALVLTDTNGARDVYQWRAPGSGTCTTEGPSYSEANGGCLSLISTGKSPVDSEFLDADPSGNDVFFTTAQSLVSQDSGLIDVYDARIGGGLPPPQEPPPACEGEACLGAPTAPEDRTPASVIAKGAGNVLAGPPPRRRCAKGKVRRRGRCVVRKRGKRRGHVQRRSRR